MSLAKHTVEISTAWKKRGNSVETAWNSTVFGFHGFSTDSVVLLYLFVSGMSRDEPGQTHRGNFHGVEKAWK